jgi:molybdopterin converting factor small subunit
MKVTVRAFGPIMEVIGRRQEVDLPPDSTLEDLARRLENDAKAKESKAPEILNSNLTVLVNGMNAEVLRSVVLKEGDHVDILSPFVGG